MRQIKEMSSIYLTHQNGLSLYISKNSVSTSLMKIEAYIGAHVLPIAALVIYCLIWLLNSNKLLFKTNSAICTRSSVGIFSVLICVLVLSEPLVRYYEGC